MLMLTTLVSLEALLAVCHTDDFRVASRKLSAEISFSRVVVVGRLSTSFF